MKYSCVPLGGLVTISGGGTPSRNNDAYWGGSIPWATVKDLKGTSLSGTQETITPEGLRDSASNLIPAGSVIVATRMGLGKVAINTIDVTINQDLKAFSCSADIEPRYLMYYLLVNASHLDSMGKGATVKGITLDVLKDLSVPLPPLPEQKRIAAILDKADSIRRKRQEAVRLTEELLRSVFLDMFGDPVTNPKGWTVVKLKDTFDLKPQIGTIVPADEHGEQLVVRVGELGKVDVALDRCKSVTLSDQELNRFYLSSGDFLLARAIGSADHLGKASIFQETSTPVVFDSHVMRLRFKKNVIHSTFFYEWLKSKGGKALFMRRAGQTAVQFNVNSEQISAIEIPLPPYFIQMKFVALFEKVRKLYQKNNHSLEGSTQLFNSLLQHAFKGELKF